MYKGVNILLLLLLLLLLHLRFYQKFKNYHAGKLNKNGLMNTCFA